mmetsp:Transcript_22451/g.62807  ORF Transcript_22451/g.62807 Transcript_22451/m.62807 type:complete len:110 (-) Transcript_22451:218-547(-)
MPTAPTRKGAKAQKTCAYTMDDLKYAFAERDTSGDGCLSYDELRDTLIRGNSSFTEKELRMLWRACDVDKEAACATRRFPRPTPKKSSARSASLTARLGQRNSAEPWPE